MKRRETRLPGQLFRSALAVLLVLLMILPAVGCAAGKKEQLPEKKDDISLQENQVNPEKEDEGAQEQGELNEAVYLGKNILPTELLTVNANRFVDNQVVVVLADEADLLSKEYTPADFPGINCVNVVDLSKSLDDSKKEVDGKMLLLELGEHSKEGVRAAISLLIARNDVWFAEPNYNVGNSQEETADPKFADDHILVVLTHEESMKFKTYTPEDFSEISCVNVQVINAGVAPSEDFKVILRLNLGEHSEEAVLNAIQLLKDREDIFSAEVDHVMKIDDDIYIGVFDVGNGVYVPSKIRWIKY